MPAPDRNPTPLTQQMLDELTKYVIAEPYPFVLDLSKCHGSFLVTIDGREIFDWAGYFGAKLIAHNHPRLYEPEYVRKLVTAANNKTASSNSVLQVTQVGYSKNSEYFFHFIL